MDIDEPYCGELSILPSRSSQQLLELCRGHARTAHRVVVTGSIIIPNRSGPCRPVIPRGKPKRTSRAPFSIHKARQCITLSLTSSASQESVHLTIRGTQQAISLTHIGISTIIPFSADNMDDRSSPNTPSHEDTEDLLLSCRYGDVDDLNSFVQRFGPGSVGDARDENGNTVLHMASANGHIGEF